MNCVVSAFQEYTELSLKQIRQNEIAENRATPSFTPVFEYRSKREFLGLPMVHIRMRGGLERGAVKGWIAVGDGAIGLVFAAGGYAIAPLSFGGFAIGLLPLGGFALGPVALGGFSLAIWAMGGFAVGWQAFGGCAVGWDAAMGAVAWAHNLAGESWFLSAAQVVAPHLAWLNLVWLLPLALWQRSVSRARGQK